MEGNIQVITAPMVNVKITSSLISFGAERRFNKDITIAEFKNKLEIITGSVAKFMDLQLQDKDGKKVMDIDNNDALLGSFPIDDGMTIHVIDTVGVKGEFEDVSKVEKYEISEESYNKRQETLRAFKQKNKIGQFKDESPEEVEKREAERKAKEEEEARLAAEINVGDRCEVDVPSNPPKKRGTVMYVGNTEFKPGIWIGVKYDEPYGKNDGSVKGKRYFQCEPKYGGFVKPQYVKTGDYPEDVMGDEDMDEM